MIVATAGHIDHGKTTLVKALTGIDTDRLPEEKKRGLTIDLGFAYHGLDDGTVMGFVDVPGHERFVGNMLAGVAAVDAALLVVAADDGPMPQTREHVAILDLLDIRQAVIAITKIDRVDPDRVRAVRASVRELLAGTSLADAPHIFVNAANGEGVDALRSRLRDMAATVAPRPSGENFRLAVDRCFTLAGVGVVVTGAAFSGRVAVGDRLLVSPSGLPVRLRELRTNDRKATEGIAGQRLALNLAGDGVETSAIRRGDWIVAEAAHGPTSRLDVRLRLLGSETRALRSGAAIHLHLGAAEVEARVDLLEGRALAPGATGFAGIALARPILGHTGDTFILRDAEARRTIGGGCVVDPLPPARGRRTPARLATLAALAKTSEAALAELVAAAPDGVDLAAFTKARNLTSKAAEDLIGRVPMITIGRGSERRGFVETRWRDLANAIEAGLDRWHREAPHRLGAGLVELGRTLPNRIAPAVLGSVLDSLVETGRIGRGGVFYRRPDHRPRLGDADETLWKQVGPLLEAGGLRPPRVRELMATLALELQPLQGFLDRAADIGLLMKVADNRYFPPPAVIALGEIAETLASEAPSGVFSAAQFRDRSGIGRNLTIRLLEFFDRAGFTRRRGDLRAVVCPARQAFPALSGPHRNSEVS